MAKLLANFAIAWGIFKDLILLVQKNSMTWNHHVFLKKYKHHFGKCHFTELSVTYAKEPKHYNYLCII